MPQSPNNIPCTSCACAPCWTDPITPHDLPTRPGPDLHAPRPHSCPCTCRAPHHPHIHPHHHHTSLCLPSYSQRQCRCCPNSSGEESETAQGKQNLLALAMFPWIRCTTLFCTACAETPWMTELGAFSRRWLSMAPGLILCHTILSYGITDASAT